MKAAGQKTHFEYSDNQSSSNLQKPKNEQKSRSVLSKMTDRVVKHHDLSAQKEKRRLDEEFLRRSNKTDFRSQNNRSKSP